MKQEQPFHFYASSFADWATTDGKRDLQGLIELMTDFGHDFTLWLVPGPWDMTYRIEHYAPQVEGAVILGRFDILKKSK